MLEQTRLDPWITLATNARAPGRSRVCNLAGLLSHVYTPCKYLYDARPEPLVSQQNLCHAVYTYNLRLISRWAKRSTVPRNKIVFIRVPKDEVSSRPAPRPVFYENPPRHPPPRLFVLHAAALDGTFRTLHTKLSLEINSPACLSSANNFSENSFFTNWRSWKLEITKSITFLLCYKN